MNEAERTIARLQAQRDELPEDPVFDDARAFIDGKIDELRSAEA